MIEKQHLLNTKELALFLNCSESLIHKLKNEGKIPYIKIGYLVRFKPEDVIDILKENAEQI